MGMDLGEPSPDLGERSFYQRTSYAESPRTRTHWFEDPAIRSESLESHEYPGEPESTEPIQFSVAWKRSAMLEGKDYFWSDMPGMSLSPGPTRNDSAILGGARPLDEDEDDDALPGAVPDDAAPELCMPVLGPPRSAARPHPL